jgi:hypothetical protein
VGGEVVKLTRRALGVTFVLAPLGRATGVPFWDNPKRCREILRTMVDYLWKEHWKNVSLAINNGTFQLSANFNFTDELVSAEDFQGGGDGECDGVRCVQEGDQEQGRDEREIHGDDDDGPVQPEVGPV